MSDKTHSVLMTQSLPRRWIRGLFSAREYAVGFLILCCVIVEAGILWFTFLYEAATAPPGAALLWGVSAAGLVVLLVEFLKLPIAWFAGTLTGWTRVSVNALALAICLLTAITIKDIWTRDWDQQLEPSRRLDDEVAGLRAKAEEQIKLASRLEQSSKAEEQARNDRIKALTDQVEQLQSRKAEEQRGHNDRVKALLEQTWDPAVREQIRSLEALRDSELQQANKDIAALNKRREEIESARADASKEANARFEAEIARAQALRAEAARRNEAREQQAYAQFKEADEQHQRDLLAYEQAKQRYESDRKAVNAEAKREIDDLMAQDKAFFNLDQKIADVEARRDSELKRLDDDWAARPRPSKPALKRPDPEPLPPLPTRDGFGQSLSTSESIDAVQAQIEGRMKDRDLALASRSDDISKLQQSAQVASSALAARVADQRRVLDEAHAAFVAQIDEQIASLLAQRRDDERARQELARSPAEIQQKLGEIPERVEALKSEASLKEAEARKLRDDTGASRFAAVLRYFMPDRTPEERLAAAYGFLPPAIGLLAAFLPALVLELGVASLHTPPAERRKQRWRFWRFGEKSRRALAIERGRLASARLDLAEEVKKREAQHRGLIEELEDQKQRLAAREEEFEISVKERALSLQAELVRTRDEAIDAKNRAVRDRDSDVAAANARAEAAIKVEQEFAELILKYRADLKRLSETVLEYDARQRP